MSVGRSVRPSIHPSALAFFGVYGRFLRYCSCPIAGKAFFITAPALPHATSVAVYTALCLLYLGAIGPFSSGSNHRNRSFLYCIQAPLDPLVLAVIIKIDLFCFCVQVPLDPLVRAVIIGIDLFLLSSGAIGPFSSDSDHWNRSFFYCI